MEVNIKVKVDASLIEAINRFCDIFEIKDIKNEVEKVIGEKEAEKVINDEPPETKKEEKEIVTIEILRLALIEVKETKGKETAKKLLTDMGVANLTALPKEKYTPLWANILTVLPEERYKPLLAKIKEVE